MLLLLQSGAGHRAGPPARHVPALLYCPAPLLLRPSVPHPLTDSQAWLQAQAAAGSQDGLEQRQLQRLVQRAGAARQGSVGGAALINQPTACLIDCLSV
jgi:hypothetical protein